MSKYFKGKRFFQRRQGGISSGHILGLVLILGLSAYLHHQPKYVSYSEPQANESEPNVIERITPRTPDELSTYAIELINRDRLAHGLPELALNELLMQAAQNHAEDMSNRDYYSHTTPEGRTPTDRFAQIGGTGGVGENIAKITGYTNRLSLTEETLAELQVGWMNSPGHRQNLLNPDYSSVGYGIVLNPSQGKVYAVQKFQ